MEIAHLAYIFNVDRCEVLSKRNHSWNKTVLWMTILHWFCGAVDCMQQA